MVRKEEQRTTMFLPLCMVLIFQCISPITGRYWSSFPALAVQRNMVRMPLPIQNKRVKTFPVEAFFNYSIASSELPRLLCSAAQKGGEARCCSCQPQCSLFGGCCVDYPWSLYTQYPLDVASHISLLESETTNSFECRYILPQAQVAEGNLGSVNVSAYMMISRCNVKADPNQISACLSHNNVSRDNRYSKPSIFPVIDKDGYLYSNQFCAQCNFVDEFRSLDLVVDCKSFPGGSFQILMDRFQKGDMGDCKVDLPKDVRSMKCGDASLLRGCNENNRLFKLCNSYMLPYHGYFNYHCWLCANDEKAGFYNQTAPYHSNCEAPVMEFGMLSWSLIVQVQKTARIALKDPFGGTRLSESCVDGKVFDITVGQCVTFSCPEQYTAKELRCVAKRKPPKTRLKQPGFHECLASRKYSIFLLHNGTNIPDLSSSVQNLLADSSYQIRNYIYWTKIAGSFDFNSLQQILNSITSSSSPTMDTVIIAPLHADSISLENVTSAGLMSGTLYHSFPQGKVCAEYLSPPVQSEDVIFTRSCGVSAGNFLFPFSNVSISMVIRKGKITRRLQLCKRFSNYPKSNSPKCLSWIIQKSKATMDQHKNLVYTTRTGKRVTYAVGTYTILPQGYSVCIDVKKPLEKIENRVAQLAFTLRKMETHISFVGTCVSPLCYTAVLATFWISKEHFPGFGLISLCVCLLFSDLLFLVALILDNIKVVIPLFMCKVLGMLTHASLLLVQLCVVVLGGDNVVVFRNLQLYEGEDARAYYRKRAKYLFFPAFFFTMSVVLDLSGTVDSQYGYGGLCLMHSFTAKILFYVTPAVLSLIFSSCCMVLTLYRIRRQSSPLREVVHASGSRKFEGGKKCSLSDEIRGPNVALIAWKLILVYGLSEVVGFVQIPRDMDSSLSAKKVNLTFAFAYTLVKSFRGMAVFVIYMCRRSVFIYFKKLVTNDKRSVAAQKLKVSATVSVDSNSGARKDEERFSNFSKTPAEHDELSFHGTSGVYDGRDVDTVYYTGNDSLKRSDTVTESKEVSLKIKRAVVLSQKLSLDLKVVTEEPENEENEVKESIENKQAEQADAEVEKEIKNGVERTKTRDYREKGKQNGDGGEKEQHGENGEGEQDGEKEEGEQTSEEDIPQLQISESTSVGIGKVGRKISYQDDQKPNIDV